MKRVFFLMTALMLLGAGCVSQSKSTSMVKPPLPSDIAKVYPDDIAKVYRNPPSSGSFLLDKTKMSPTFAVKYEYRGGSYQGSEGYTISLQARQKGQILSGDKTATFPVDDAKLEELYHLIVTANVFNAEPPMALVRVREVIGPLFGIGGSKVALQAQADRIIAPLPSIPFKVRDANIDIGRVMRIKGIPATITPELLNQAVAEAKDLTKVFEAIEELVPDEAREKVK